MPGDGAREVLHDDLISSARKHEPAVRQIAGAGTTLTGTLGRASTREVDKKAKATAAERRASKPTAARINRTVRTLCLGMERETTWSKLPTALTSSETIPDSELSPLHEPAVRQIAGAGTTLTGTLGRASTREVDKKAKATAAERRASKPTAARINRTAHTLCLGMEREKYCTTT